MFKDSFPENFLQRCRYEKNISAQQYFTQAYPRFSGEDVDQKRSSRYQAQKGQGAQKSGCPHCNQVTSVFDGQASFPKSVRLRKRADFIRLSTASSTYVVKGFLLVWQANELMQPRLGVTASKKVGCAVIRNRIKRYIREAFRHNRHTLPAVDMNVIARRESAAMDFPSSLRELEKAFRHIGTSPCSRASRSL